ncbi:LytR family transcriptional attenuator [Homoserinimonas aerilata]|uniref:LytR family transcriptional attenuator n=1 Tax=Homoserinimonas aerilata TaxID=1162970 RepID=A0A542YKN8_9MICO|nr:LCP family protein [Homoserinimonas aerilata]TQL48665.1 LytR family transcriptional attenuator [Homoserinimonas aerilata]
MTKRAWWLVVLNLFIPGTAQMLAGNRRLGRFGVSATFLLWALLLVALLVFLLNRTLLIMAATNPIVLTVVQVLLSAYAVLWVVLTLDALRLVRLVRASSGARPFIAGLAVVALVAVAGGAAYAGHLAGVTRDTISSVFDSGDYAEPIDGRYNIMLLGGDAGPDRMGLRPDSISVVSVDAETGSTTIVGLPRNLEHATFSAGSPLFDVWPTGYDCGDECLLGYLYTVGMENSDLYPDAEAHGSNAGVEAMRDAVEGVTGLTMQYYVLIDMQGFSDLVDALGGIDVTVPERLAYGPVTATEPYGYFEAGPQHMGGESALWYARSRFDGNDFERMARQRQVQEAIIAQVDPANVVTKFEAVANAGAQVVKTDIPQVMLGLFVDMASKARGLPLNTVEIAPPDVDTANPDFEVIHSMVQGALLSPSAPPAQ